jgi:hypothetical protein
MVTNDFSAKLLLIFQNVNEWLKFAEAKNAALLAFSGTAVTAILTVLVTATSLPVSLRVALLISTGSLSICTLISALSFLPKTNLEKILWLRNRPSSAIPQPEATDNFYYFGHLQKYNADNLLEALNIHYFNDGMTPNKECRDIAVQVTVNSGIASMKFQFFTYALSFLIAAIVIIPSIILFQIISGRGL